MTGEIDRIKFGGKAHRIAEKELCASFNYDKDSRLMDRLYEEYQIAGSPKKTDMWLRERLTRLFQCVEERPRWIEKSVVPPWPFTCGLPMVFIRQIEVPNNEMSEASIGTGVNLYIFGSRVDGDYGGWKSCYQVVEQLSDFP